MSDTAHIYGVLQAFAYALQDVYAYEKKQQLNSYEMIWLRNHNKGCMLVASYQSLSSWLLP